MLHFAHMDAKHHGFEPVCGIYAHGDLQAHVDAEPLADAPGDLLSIWSKDELAHLPDGDHPATYLDRSGSMHTCTFYFWRRKHAPWAGLLCMDTDGASREYARRMLKQKATSI